MTSARRKQLRLPASNYEAGWFFVTICTDQHNSILSSIKPAVGADDSVRPCAAFQTYEQQLTPVGLVVQACMERLSNTTAGILVDKYVIMPNHVHIIIYLDERTGGQSRPPLQGIIQQFKSISTRLCWPYGLKTIWQRSFYDHAIRCEDEYRRIWQYIDENPAKWTEDEYYFAE